MTGTIFNIQKFCVNDGPGNKDGGFYKGLSVKMRMVPQPGVPIAEGGNNVLRR